MPSLSTLILTNFLSCLLVFTPYVNAFPADSAKRETSCIAAGTCPGIDDNPSTPATASAPTPASTDSAPDLSAIASALPTQAIAGISDSFPIKKGYVAFGDSFAAGFGTGTTTGDACRLGEFSFPKQIAADAPPDIDFQNLACSGAVITEILEAGPESQIDKWTNPENADIATISIGGNDVGFSEIVQACVLQPLGGFGQVFSYDCQGSINKAAGIIRSTDLYRNIFSALTQIIDKSTRPDFKIYFTGYPAFFNVDTTYCNDVTFFYSAPHHRPLPINDGYPYLSQDLRLQLNNLLQDLNTFISGLVNDFNSQQKFEGNPQVVYVHTDPAFNGHRFCEEGVNEPDSGHLDTWFFLSAWPDNTLPGVAGLGGSVASLVANEVVAGNDTALPDPRACDPNDTDMGAALQCAYSIMIAEGQPDAVQAFADDQAAIASGDFGAVRVPWWMPTRQGKTFHPRTLGHKAYKETIYSHF